MSQGVLLDDVGFSYSRRFSVDVNISADVNRVTCLLGMSGSGKTSILRLMAGLLKPSKGIVYINGKQMNGEGWFLPPYDRGVCAVFQTPSLLPYKTVISNVLFAMRGKEELQQKIIIANDFLKNMGMLEHAHKYPNELSMGQQQRVALARAFASGAETMLLDEPFSNLDVESGAQAREYLASLIKRHTRTVILITHSATEAMVLGDYVYVIDRGKVAQSGTPRDLYHNPCNLFVARFFGQLNVIHVQTDVYGNVLLPFAACLRSKFKNMVVAVGIRHESIMIAKSSDLDCSIAVVTNIRFFGAYDVVRLMFCGGDALDMRCDAGDKNIQVGCPVRVKFDWDAAVIFAMDPEKI